MSDLMERKTRLIVVTPTSVRERSRSREVVLHLHRWGMEVRLKGLRTRYPLSYDGLYQHAARVAAERKRAERRNKKSQTCKPKGGL